MLLDKRKELIINTLNQKKYLSINQLAKELYCSPSTIRRDTIFLEDKGLIRRYHGGVSIIPKYNKEIPRILREKEAIEEKKYICQIAKIFLADGLSMFVDASSTTNQLSSYFNEFANLTVVTNGLKTALDLSMIQNTEIFFAGGEIKVSSNATVGEITNDFMKDFHLNTTFISCRGIDEGGIYEADYAQASVKRQMISNSKQTILLCDDTKIGKSNIYKLSNFDNIDTIITNKKPPTSIIEAVQAQDSEIIW